METPRALDEAATPAPETRVIPRILTAVPQQFISIFVRAPEPQPTDTGNEVGETVSPTNN